jgi:hypothetical protein
VASVIAFLPIARYRVEYQVASGRPFSSFERLLLRAVNDGHGTVDTLADMFAVHRRLIVEGLVTLMQAGWVSLGTGESVFVLSASGVKACEGQDLPPTIALSERHLTIVVEKVTGQVARNNEVDFQSRSSLRNLWEAGVALRKGEVSNIVDPALISPLLQHQPTEWIRWIGPITVISDNAAFAVIDFDVNTERLIGLPKSWSALLLPECLREVRRRERDLADRGAAIPQDLERELRQFVRRDLSESNPDEISDIDIKWSAMTIGSSDILRSFDAHREALTGLINEAVNYAAIACPYLGNVAVAELLPVLVNGLARGLLINVFLGQIPSKNDIEARLAFDALKKLEYDSWHGAHSGRLTVGTRATECWTNIALVDTSYGASAIVGSHSWTASQPKKYPPEVSVHFRNPWAVARLCEILDGFSSADERLRLEAGFVRLQKAAGDLRQLKQSDAQLSSDANECQGSILLDRDHQELIYSIISGAKRTISVFTDNLNSFSQLGWMGFLVEPSRRLGPGVRVIYGSPTNLNVRDIPELENLLKMGAVFVANSTLSGVLIVVDGSHVILTSSRVDAASARHSSSARIGVAIRGEGLESRLFDQNL